MGPKKYVIYCSILWVGVVFETVYKYDINDINQHLFNFICIKTQIKSCGV